MLNKYDTNIMETRAIYYYHDYVISIMISVHSFTVFVSMRSTINITNEIIYEL